MLISFFQLLPETDVTLLNVFSVCAPEWDLQQKSAQRYQKDYFFQSFIYGRIFCRQLLIRNFFPWAFSHLFVWEYWSCSSIFPSRLYFLNFWVLYFPFQSVFCLWLSPECNSSKWINYSRNNLFSMSVSQNGSCSLFYHLDLFFYVIIPSNAIIPKIVTIPFSALLLSHQLYPSPICSIFQFSLLNDILCDENFSKWNFYLTS